MEMLRDKFISLIVKSDGEDALNDVIFKAAATANLAHVPAPVERHEANGRAEENLRDLRELLQVFDRGCTCSWH